MEDARRDGYGPPACTRCSFLSHFSSRSPVFRMRLRHDLPQTNHEKKREEKRRGAGAARSEGRTRGRERERKKWERGVKGTERDGKRGWKRAAFAPTHAREVATRGWQE